MTILFDHFAIFYCCLKILSIASPALNCIWKLVHFAFPGRPLVMVHLDTQTLIYMHTYITQSSFSQ